MICAGCKEWHDTPGEVLRCHMLPEKNPIRFNEHGEAEPDGAHPNMRCTMVGVGMRDAPGYTPEELHEIRNLRLAEKDTYLFVPFKQKEEVRDLGAKWDNNRKRWFCPEGVNLTPLEKWTKRP